MAIKGANAVGLAGEESGPVKEHPKLPSISPATAGPQPPNIRRLLGQKEAHCGGLTVTETVSVPSGGESQDSFWTLL